MTNYFDIKDLFKIYWGYNALPYPEAIIDRIAPPIANYKAKDYEKKIIPALNTVSKLGVNFYEKNIVGREFFMPINLDGYILQNTIFSTNRRKNIEETFLPGRPGSVKELISDNDIVFNVKGIIVGHGNNYPEEEVTKLNDLYIKHKALKIKNAIAAILFHNNEKVVIFDLNLLEIKMQNTQAFDMVLKSDNDFEIVFK